RASRAGACELAFEIRDALPEKLVLGAHQLHVPRGPRHDAAISLARMVAHSAFERFGSGIGSFRPDRADSRQPVPFGLVAVGALPGVEAGAASGAPPPAGVLLPAGFFPSLSTMANTSSRGAPPRTKLTRSS